MSVEPLLRPATPRAFLPRWLPLATVVLGLTPLACTLLGLASTSVAVAFGIGASTIVHSGLLVRLAWHVHTSMRPAGLCRSAGFTGLATLAAGGTTVAAILLSQRSAGASPNSAPMASAPTAADLTAGGLLLATLLYLLALLLLPGVAAT